MAIDLAKLCQELEAFETPNWAVEAILDVEILTRMVIDPCCGTGALVSPVMARGHLLITMDVMDWSKVLPCAPPDVVGNFLTSTHIGEFTVFMNPPFSTACEFVDRARNLGARKIVCFQRQAWRETEERRAWWEANPPARVWLCGGRAPCWRFDLATCQHPEGEASCPNFTRKGKKHETQGCAKCMGGTPTAHAWYVWERGHKGAEINNAIYPPAKKAKP